MYTKKTPKERREFLDNLEKKYAKKIQLRAFHQESVRMSRTLLSLRGTNPQDLQLRFM